MKILTVIPIETCIVETDEEHEYSIYRRSAQSDNIIWEYKCGDWWESFCFDEKELEEAYQNWLKEKK